jgi:hypothetical protein
MLIRMLVGFYNGNQAFLGRQEIVPDLCAKSSLRPCGATITTVLHIAERAPTHVDKGDADIKKLV